MNERIKLLAEQATRRYDRLGFEIPFAQPDLEVFAQLIVKECAKIVTIWSEEEPCSEGYDITPVHKMKEHFGVEE